MNEENKIRLICALWGGTVGMVIGTVLEALHVTLYHSVWT
jgi:hypothetical protein